MSVVLGKRTIINIIDGAILEYYHPRCSRNASKSMVSWTIQDGGFSAVIEYSGTRFSQHFTGEATEKYESMIETICMKIGYAWLRLAIGKE